MRRSASLLPFVLALAALVAPSGVGAFPFAHETAVPSGVPLSVEQDSSGRLHLVYLLGADLYLAVRDGETWSSELVFPSPASPLVIDTASLSLDAQDVPHLAISLVDIFEPAYGYDLWYAVRPTGTWVSEPVDTAGSTGAFPSLDVDSQGRPHVVYSRADGTVWYGVKDGSWSFLQIDPGASLGQFSSIVVDSFDRPHVCYQNKTDGTVEYAARWNGLWTYETVDSLVAGSIPVSLALDAGHRPHVAYSSGFVYYAALDGSWNPVAVHLDGAIRQESLGLTADGDPRVLVKSGSDLVYVEREGFTWPSVAVQQTGNSVLEFLQLDLQDQPVVLYYDPDIAGIRLADTALRLFTPAGGEVWPVGAERRITWHGAGNVDILLSADGGVTFDRLAASVPGALDGNGHYDLRVPHLPTRFGVMKVERDTFFSSAESDSFFTIEASIALLGLKAEPRDGGGVLLSWSTDPGPADLAGYRIDRSLDGGPFTPLLGLTSETSYLDPTGRPGARYRLEAVNGLGGSLLVGEVAVTPRAALAAWPLPYRGSDLHVSFATHGGLGGGSAHASVSIHDLSGRLIRTLGEAAYPAGIQTAVWDGRDAAGRPVGNGVYFLRAASAGESTELKVVVIR